MPFMVGSTTVSAMAVARAASTALPPLSSMRRPACAASGCDVATTLAASTGMRWEAYGKSQVKRVMVGGYSSTAAGARANKDRASTGATNGRSSEDRLQG